MTTFLFWLAIALGVFAFPLAAFGWVLLPFSVISLFNEFAAPRDVLIALLLMSFCTSFPPIQMMCGQIWRLLDPGEDNFKHACLLGSEMLSSALVVWFLVSKGWIGTDQSTWLLTSYWFISIGQLSSGFCFVLTERCTRYRRARGK